MTGSMLMSYLLATGKFTKPQVRRMKYNQLYAIWYRLSGQSKTPKYRR